jgi:hypothetical protein
MADQLNECHVEADQRWRESCLEALGSGLNRDRVGCAVVAPCPESILLEKRFWDSEKKIQRRGIASTNHTLFVSTIGPVGVRHCGPSCEHHGAPHVCGGGVVYQWGVFQMSASDCLCRFGPGTLCDATTRQTKRVSSFVRRQEQHNSRHRFPRSLFNSHVYLMSPSP